MRTLLSRWAAALSVCGVAQAQSSSAFPAADVRDTFFGTVVEDPDRALENEKDPAVAARKKAPADHAAADLEGIAGDGKLKDRIAELVNAAASCVGTVNDTATRRRIGAPIDRAHYSGESWLADGKSFLFTRGPVVSAEAPVGEKLRNLRAYLHRVDADASSGLVLAGVGIDPRIPLRPTEGPYVVATPGSSFALVVISDGVRRELRLYAAPIASITGAGTPWVEPCDVSDKVTDFGVFGNQVCLVTHRDDPRSSIVKVDLAGPGLRGAVAVVPAGDGVIEQIAPGRSGHGPRSTKAHRQRQIAHDHAFRLLEAGHPAFARAAPAGC